MSISLSLYIYIYIHSYLSNTTCLTKATQGEHGEGPGVVRDHHGRVHPHHAGLPIVSDGRS